MVTSTSKDKHNAQQSERQNEICAATAAGVICTLIGHPLDTIKVHLQVHARPSPSAASTVKHFHKTQLSSYQTAMTLWNQRALFRGIGPPMINSIIMNTVMFGAFGAVKDVGIRNNDDNKDDSSCGSSQPPPIGQSIVAGIVAGVITACISTPTDYIKIQSQLQPSEAAGNREASSLTIIKDVIRTRHFDILYRGHTANLLREGIFTAVYLGLYDIIMSRWRPSMISFGEERDSLKNEKERPLWKVVIVSSITGAMAWVVSYPADTVKSVMQSKGIHERAYGLMEASKVIYRRTEQPSSSPSIKSFYRGCAASTTRAALVTSLRMVTYEAVMGWIKT